MHKETQTTKRGDNIKITGSWGGLPIWRYKTPEEILQENKVKVESANIFIGINETYHD